MLVESMLKNVFFAVFLQILSEFFSVGVPSACGKEYNSRKPIKDFKLFKNIFLIYLEYIKKCFRYESTETG